MTPAEAAARIRRAMRKPLRPEARYSDVRVLDANGNQIRTITTAELDAREQEKERRRPIALFAISKTPIAPTAPRKRSRTQVEWAENSW